MAPFLPHCGVMPKQGAGWCQALPGAAAAPAHFPGHSPVVAGWDPVGGSTPQPLRVGCPGTHKVLAQPVGPGKGGKTGGSAVALPLSC